MLYVQNLIWGIIKEIPLLIIFFYILDIVGAKEVINKTNIFFNKSLVMSIIFILTLTVNGIFNVDVLTVDYIFNNNYTINYNLYHEIVYQLKDVIDWKIKAIIEIFGNVFLFMPFGFFYSYFLWCKNVRIWKVMLGGCIFSFIIEMTQLIFGRVFDIKDIMLNVFGTLIGYYMFSYLNQVIIPLWGQDMDTGNKYVVKKMKLKHFEILILLLMYLRMII